MGKIGKEVNFGRVWLGGEATPLPGAETANWPVC